MRPSDPTNPTIADSRHRGIATAPRLVLAAAAILLGAGCDDGTISDPNDNLTPPDLSDVVIDPQVLEVFAASGSVSVEVTAETPDGVTDVTAVVRSPSGNERTRCTSRAPATGSNTAGTWQCDLDFPQGAETGVWALDTLAVASGGTSGGVEYFTGAQVAAEGYDTDVEIRGEVPEPTALTLTPESAELPTRQSRVTLQAVVVDQYGDTVRGPDINWSSGDSSVATVDTLGTVQPTGLGTTDVTAAVGTLSDISTIVVPATPTQVDTDPPGAVMEVSDTIRFRAAVLDQFGDTIPGQDITWTAGDGVTVDPDGLVTAVAPTGSGSVTATSGSVSRRATIVVNPTAADVSIQLAASPGEVRPGDTVRFDLTVANAGPTPSVDLIARLWIPSNATGARVISVSPGCTELANSLQQVDCLVDPLTVGADTTFSVEVVSDDPGYLVVSSEVKTVFGTDSGDPDPTNNATSASVRVRNEADLALSLRTTPDTAKIDEAITLSAEIRNLGPDLTAQDWLLLVDLGEGSFLNQYVTVASRPPGCSGYRLILTCDLPPGISPGSALVLDFGVTSVRGVTVPVAARVAYNGPYVGADHDPVLGNNTDSLEAQFVPLEGDLSVSVVGPGAPVVAGDTILYDLTVTNAGPDSVMDVFAALNLEADAPVTPYGPCGKGGAGTATGIGCNVGTMRAGESFTVQIPVGTSGEGFVTATGFSYIRAGFSVALDPDHSNDSAQVVTEVEPGLTGADLSAAVSGPATEVNPDSSFAIGLTVANSGPESSGTIDLLMDATYGSRPDSISLGPLPAGCVEETPSTEPGVRVACTLAELAAGGGATTSVPVIPIGNGGLVEVSVTVSGAGSVDPDPGNNNATRTFNVAEREADLSVSIVANPDPATVGEEVVHQVTLSNAGPERVRSPEVVITYEGDVVSSSLTGLDACVGLRDLANGWGCLLSLSGLAAGETADFAFSLIPQSVGAVVGTAMVGGYADAVDPNRDNDAASDTTTVDAAAAVDLSLVSYDLTPNPVTRTAELTHTVVFENLGTETVTEAVANIRTTGDVQFGNGAGCTGVTFTGGRGYNCFVTDLAPGGQHTFTVSLLPGSAGQLLDSEVSLAVVTGGTETDLSDNTGSATAEVVAFSLPVSVSIANPADGASLSSGSTISFQGDVIDSQGVNVGGSLDLEWTSSIDGRLAAAASFSTSSLSPGSHEIVLTARDGTTLLGADTAQVTVQGSADLAMSVGAYGAGANLAPTYLLGDTVPMFASLNALNGQDAVSDGVLTVTVTGDVASAASPGPACTEETLTSPARLRWTCDLPTLGPSTGSEILDLAFVPQTTESITVVGRVSSASMAEENPVDNADSESTTILVSEPDFASAELVFLMGAPTASDDLGGPYTVGETVQLAARVGTITSVDAPGVVVSVTVFGAATAAGTPPAGCSVVTHSADEFQWLCNVGTITAGTFVDIPLPFTTDAPGSVIVAASSTSALPDPTASNNNEREAADVN